MDFQSRKLWIVILVANLYMDFKTVQGFMMCLLGT